MLQYWGSIEDSVYATPGEHTVMDLIDELRSPKHTVYQCKVTNFENAPYNGYLSADVVNVSGAVHSNARNVKRFEMIKWSDLSGPYGLVIQSLHRLVPCRNISCNIFIRMNVEGSTRWPPLLEDSSFDGTITRSLLHRLRRENNYDTYFSVYRVYDVYVPSEWLASTAPVDSTAGLLALHHVSITNGVIKRPISTDDIFTATPCEIEKWNSEFKLRSHQIAALQWMRWCELQREFNIANNMRLGSSYASVMNIPHPHVVTESAPKHNRYIQRGGILTNTVGSGKTAVAIALCQTPIAVQSSSSTSSSKASLVIVDINLLTQWKTEIRKFLDSPNIVVVKTIVQYRKLSTAALKNADFVLTTFNFLKSPKYVENLRQKVRAFDAHAPTNHMSGVQLRQFVAKYGCGNQNVLMPPFESIEFRRIIVDEIHEMRTLLPRDGSYILQALRCQAFWGLSGTWRAYSLSDFKRFANLFFTCDTADAFSEVDVLTLWQQCSRSFKVPALPPVQEHCYRIKLTRAEMSLQQSCVENNDAVALATCYNGGSLSNTSSDTIVFQSIEALYTKMLDVLQASIDRNTAARANAQLVQDTMTLAPDEYSIAEIRNAAQRVTDISTRLTQDEQRMTYLRNASISMEANQTCPVCIQEPCNTVTQCGHAFCHSCISQCVQRKMSCPMCKQGLVGTRLATVSTGENVPPEGTKLQAFIHQLNLITASGEQVVAFVQWSTLCKAVMSAFKIKQVNAACLRGNESCRAKTLQQFRQGDISVLILSMETSNAGIDLSNANHVVFLHPVVACNPKEAIEMRFQAVARVHRIGQPKQVHVHHYVCDDTVEEKLFTEQCNAMR